MLWIILVIVVLGYFYLTRDKAKDEITDKIIRFLYKGEDTISHSEDIANDVINYTLNKHNESYPYNRKPVLDTLKMCLNMQTKKDCKQLSLKDYGAVHTIFKFLVKTALKSLRSQKQTNIFFEKISLILETLNKSYFEGNGVLENKGDNEYRFHILNDFNHPIFSFKELDSNFLTIKISYPLLGLDRYENFESTFFISNTNIISRNEQIQILAKFFTDFVTTKSIKDKSKHKDTLEKIVHLMKD